MVKIKRKLEMTLPELIECAWENEVSDKAFYSNLDGGSVYFDKIQNLSIEHEIAINETFTVEVEEEITENTVLPVALEIVEGAIAESAYIKRQTSIKRILVESGHARLTTKYIYLQNEDGTMTLVWKDGAMVE